MPCGVALGRGEGGIEEVRVVTEEELYWKIKSVKPRVWSVNAGLGEGEFIYRKGLTMLLKDLGSAERADVRKMMEKHLRSGPVRPNRGRQWKSYFMVLVEREGGGFDDTGVRAKNRSGCWRVMKRARDERGMKWRGKIWIVSCRERRTLREDGDLDWQNVKEVCEDADLTTGEYMSVRKTSEQLAEEREARKARRAEAAKRKKEVERENIKLFGTAGGAADLLRKLCGPDRNITLT